MNRPRWWLGVACVVASVSATAQGPEAAPQPRKPPTPEETQKTFDGMMNSMIPLQTRVAEATVEAQLAIAERPETAARIATFKKNLFDALKAKGFTAEQALLITQSTPVPGSR